MAIRCKMRLSQVIGQTLAVAQRQSFHCRYDPKLVVAEDASFQKATPSRWLSSRLTTPKLLRQLCNWPNLLLRYHAGTSCLITNRFHEPA